MEIETTLADLPKHLEILPHPPEAKVHLIVEDIDSKVDIILQLGTTPVACNSMNASTEHDWYLTSHSE